MKHFEQIQKTKDEDADVAEVQDTDWVTTFNKIAETKKDSFILG
jgi:hypothetical protein